MQTHTLSWGELVKFNVKPSYSPGIKEAEEPVKWSKSQPSSIYENMSATYRLEHHHHAACRYKMSYQQHLLLTDSYLHRASDLGLNIQLDFFSFSFIDLPHLNQSECLCPPYLYVSDQKLIQKHHFQRGGKSLISIY